MVNPTETAGNAEEEVACMLVFIPLNNDRSEARCLPLSESEESEVVT